MSILRGRITLGTWPVSVRELGFSIEQRVTGAIPKGLPYLTGLVIHCELTEKSSAA